VSRWGVSVLWNTGGVVAAGWRGIHQIFLALRAYWTEIGFLRAGRLKESV